MRNALAIRLRAEWYRHGLHDHDGWHDGGRIMRADELRSAVDAFGAVLLRLTDPNGPTEDDQ